MTSAVRGCSAAAFVVSFLCLPLGVEAQLARSESFTLDNDYFTFWLPPRQRSDDNYTHGVRASLDLAGKPPSLARRIVCGSMVACGGTLEVGQEMYTPTRDGAEPVPGERAYAGWLYMRARTRGGNANALRTIGVTVGVTGPASLAEASQSAIHKIAPQFRQPLGWDHQLPTEVAAGVEAMQQWRLTLPGGSRAIDLLPAVDANLGTIRTSARGGALLRVGPAMPHPWMDEGTRRFTLYLFTGARSEVILRDLFLHGSTFGRSVRVDPEPVVTEWDRGFRVGLGSLALEYRAATRSREYRTGPRKHTHASMGVRWALQ